MDPPVRITWKLHSRILPALVGTLVVLQLTVPFKGWIVSLIVLGGAWLVAYLWVRSLARGLRLVREMRFGWAQVGDRLEERFELLNASAVPALWVEVIDHSTLPGYSASRATGVEGEAQNSWTCHGICTRRGVFTLGPTTLRSGDPFGLYTLSMDYSASTNMMVMPPIVPLPRIEVAPGGRAGEARRQTNSLERTVNAAGVRGYVPGDGLNWIHWRASAHHDDWMVRLFDSAPSGDWWIVLDLDRQVQIGEGQDSTVEHAVILAASLADAGLRLRRGVGMVVNGEPLTWLPPAAGETRRWEILRALALVSPGTYSLAELLTRLRLSLKQAASLVVITPAAQGRWLPSLLALRWHGAVPTVLLLDPRSFGGEGDTHSTLARLTDCEIARYVITRDVLDRPDTRPGQQGSWDWRVSPRGRAIPVLKPHDTTWKALT